MPSSNEGTADKSGSRGALVSGALAILGSTGVISVYGPITGELYWNGFLSAYGLSSLEFPASDSEVRVHAFAAIALGVVEVWAKLPSAFLGVFGLALSIALFFMIRQWLPDHVKASVLQRMSAVTAWKSRRKSAAEALFIVLFGVATCTVGMIVLSAFSLVVVSPFYANSAGQREGRLALKKIQTTSVSCMDVQADGLSFKCPHVVAYGKEHLGVFDGGRIYRVPRASAVVSSPVPIEKQP